MEFFSAILLCDSFIYIYFKYLYFFKQDDYSKLSNMPLQMKHFSNTFLNEKCSQVLHKIMYLNAQWKNIQPNQA